MELGVGQYSGLDNRGNYGDYRGMTTNPPDMPPYVIVVVLVLGLAVVVLGVLRAFGLF